MKKNVVLMFLILLIFSGLAQQNQILAKNDEPRKTAKKLNYLVIATSTLRKSALAFAKYRRTQGLKTQVKTVVECMKQFPKAKPEIAIQKMIMKYRRAVDLGKSAELEAKPLEPPKNPEAPNFCVLLLGDIQPYKTKFNQQKHIPGFYKIFKTDPGISGPEQKEDVPSDNSYACRPKDDDVPTIPVGRLPFHTNKECMDYLEAVKNYENNQPVGIWQRRLTLFAGDPNFQDVNPYFNALIENVFKKGVLDNLGTEYEGTFTYANVDSPYAFAPEKFSEKLVNEINQGALILNYLGHGWKTSVDLLRFKDKTYEIFTVADAQKVDCKGKSPVAGFFTCYTGCYDMQKYSLAETLLANPKGPIGVIASSRISSDANYLLETAFLKAFTIEKVKTLGSLFLRMKRLMLADEMPMGELIKRFKLPVDLLKGYAEGKRSHLWLYNLFGDPALKLAHPKQTCEIELSKDKIQPGEKLDVLVKNPWICRGKLFVTLECKIADFIEIPKKLKIDDKNFAEQAIKNHEIANNKVVLSLRLKISKIENSVGFIIPPDLKPGKYLIRAFVKSEKESAFTAKEFIVVNSQ